MLAHWKGVVLSVGPFVPLLLGYFAYTTLGSTYKLSSSGFDISKMSQDQLEKRYAHLSRDAIAIAKNAQRTENHPNMNVVNMMECCVLTDIPLFVSKTKYDSGSGWPSFYAI